MPGYMTDDFNCPLCWMPLDGERHFHLECAKRENASADEDTSEDEGE